MPPLLRDIMSPSSKTQVQYSVLLIDRWPRSCACHTQDREARPFRFEQYSMAGNQEVSMVVQCMAIAQGMYVLTWTHDCWYRCDR